MKLSALLFVFIKVSILCWCNHTQQEGRRIISHTNYVSTLLYLSILLFYITGSPFLCKRSKLVGDLDPFLPFHDADNCSLSFIGDDNTLLDLDMMATPEVVATPSSIKNAPMTRPLTFDVMLVSYATSQVLAFCSFHAQNYYLS